MDDPESPTTTTTKQKAQQLIQPILDAPTRSQQIQQLDQLEVETTAKNEWLHEIAVVCLLQQLTEMGNSKSDRQLATALVQTFGTTPVRNASVQVLKELSIATNGAASTSISISLELTARSLYHVIFDTEWWLDDVSGCQPLYELMLNLPKLVCNACGTLHHPFPKWCVERRYQTQLTHRLVEWSVQHQDYTHARAFCTNLLRRGGESMVTGLYRWYSDAPTTTTTTVLSTLVHALLDHRPEKDVARFARSVLRHHLGLPRLSSVEWLDGTLLGVMNHHAVAVTKWVVLEPSSVIRLSDDNKQNPDTIVDKELCVLYAKLLARVTDDPSTSNDNVSQSDNLEWTELDCKPATSNVHVAFWRAFALVAKHWSTTEFVRQSDPVLQRHVTFFILACLALLQDERIPTENYITERLIDGVGTRLSTTISEIRSDGLRVGNLLAKRLGQDIEFEELQDDEFDIFSEPLPQKQSESVQEKEAFIEQLEKQTLCRRNVDPDANHKGSDDSVSKNGDQSAYDDDSEWDGSSWEPYDLEDDQEDLRTVPRPLYLSECLDYLRSAENEEEAFDRIESALSEIPEIARSRPSDLVDIGPELARVLLRLENKSNFEDFTSLVDTSLHELTVQEPQAIGLNLIREMFEDGSLNDRLRVLKTLKCSAFRLSGLDRLTAVPATSADNRNLIQDASKVFGKRDILSQAESTTTDIQSDFDGTRRTLRWGKGRLAYTGNDSVPLSRNRFKGVAPVWFYTLVSMFVERREERSLWSGDNGALLLSELFETLSSIIVSAGPYCPGIDLLARDLFELVWPFHDAEIAEVRSSVLFASGTAIDLLTSEMLMNLLMDASVGSMTKNLKTIAEHDPNNDCRKLARLLCGSVTAALQMMNEPQNQLLVERSTIMRPS